MWVDNEPSSRPMWVAGLVLLMVLAAVALLST
jgi:MYXO-CTERM domain-containing protein